MESNETHPIAEPDGAFRQPSLFSNPAPGAAAGKPPVFWIGTSGWTYDHWKGGFYPAGLAKSRWFDFYAEHFLTVEVNATFHGAFKDQTFLNWKEQAPSGFRYVFKAPKAITHTRYLLDAGEDIQNFSRSAALVGDHLGMLLLQVAPATPYDLPRLQQALRAFPDAAQVAVEFRNPQWLSSETEELLQRLGATFCNADSPQQKLTDRLTSKRAYLRLHGRKQWYSYNYSPDELKEIAGLAQELARRGADPVYIFFNNDLDGYAPINALAMRELLNA